MSSQHRATPYGRASQVGLTGAFSQSLLAFVLPPAFYLQLHAKACGARSGVLNAECGLSVLCIRHEMMYSDVRSHGAVVRGWQELQRDRRSLARALCVHGSMLVFGCVVCVVATAQILTAQ